jgi:hypothetical protein
MRGGRVDIGTWLRDLGMGQYEQAFPANAVDLHLASELTDSQLKELGVAIGDRIQFSRAAQALRRPGRRRPVAP